MVKGPWMSTNLNVSYRSLQAKLSWRQNVPRDGGHVAMETASAQRSRSTLADLCDSYIFLNCFYFGTARSS